MKKEDIKKLDVEAYKEAAKRINDLVKKVPSDEFFDEIEKTESSIKISEDLPKSASNNSNNSIENTF